MHVGNVRWLAAAHGTLAAIGVVAVIAPLVPVEDSPLLRFEELNRSIFIAAALIALVVGLIEGLLLRLPNREVGQGLGTVLAMIAGVPVYGAMMFAYAPWWRDEVLRVPVGNLVSARRGAAHGWRGGAVSRWLCSASPSRTSTGDCGRGENRAGTWCRRRRSPDIRLRRGRMLLHT